MSRIIAIQIPDLAYERLELVANAQNTTVTDYARNLLKVEVLQKMEREAFGNYLTSLRRKYAQDDEYARWKKVKARAYVLKRWKNGNSLILEWKVARIPELEAMRRPEFHGHQDEYYVRVYKRVPTAYPGVRDDRYAFYRRPKFLKRAVDRWFKKYGHSAFFK